MQLVFPTIDSCHVALAKSKVELANDQVVPPRENPEKKYLSNTPKLLTCLPYNTSVACPA